MALAENLKLLRKRRGLTQQQLADLSGVSCNSIINYETNRRNSPPISILNKLARALETSVDTLTADKIEFRKERVYVWPRSEPMAPVDDWEEFMEERGNRDVAERLSELVRFLNKEGAAEALKRVRELTEIQRYSIASVMRPQPSPYPSLKSQSRDRKWEDVEWQEDAPPTAAEPNPGSDPTDAGK